MKTKKYYYAILNNSNIVYAYTDKPNESMRGGFLNKQDCIKSAEKVRDSRKQEVKIEVISETRNTETVLLCALAASIVYVGIAIVIIIRVCGE